MIKLFGVTIAAIIVFKRGHKVLICMQPAEKGNGEGLEKPVEGVGRR